jgi:hypothetical protein
LTSNAHLSAETVIEIARSIYETDKNNKHKTILANITRLMTYEAKRAAKPEKLDSIKIKEKRG